MKNIVLAVFACSLLLLPRVAVAFELRLDAFEAKSPTLSLMDEPSQIPAAMHRAVAADIEAAFTDNAQSWVADVEARNVDAAAFEGGGQMAPENAWLAFVLGLIGFGLGHFVVAGDGRGGTRWLIIDIVFVAVWIVLDVLLGGLYGYDGWGFWWLIFDVFLPIGWVVEHVFQGLSAYRAATGRSLFAHAPAGPATEGEFAVEPNRPFPNILAWGF